MELMIAEGLTSPTHKIIYFTFGDEEFTCRLRETYRLLMNQKATVPPLLLGSCSCDIKLTPV